MEGPQDMDLELPEEVKRWLESMGPETSNKRAKTELTARIQASASGPLDPNLLSMDVIQSIVTFFSYREVLGLILGGPNRELHERLTSNVLWGRLVARDYPYVHTAITGAPEEVKASVRGAIIAMANEQDLSPENHEKRFWKRVYEWALRTSRDPVVYKIGDGMKAIGWYDVHILVTENVIPVTGHIRIVNTFTKTIELDVQLAGVKTVYQDNAHYHVAPPFLAIQQIYEARKHPAGIKDPDEINGRTFVQIWNVTTGDKVAEFYIREHTVDAMHIVAVPEERVPAVFYYAQDNRAKPESYENDFVWRWTPRGPDIAISKRFSAGAAGFSDHYFFDFDDANDTFGVLDLLTGRPISAFDWLSDRDEERVIVGEGVIAGIRFAFPYLSIKSTEGGPHRYVYDVSRLDASTIWEAEGDYKAALGKGFIVTKRIEDVDERGITWSTFHALPPPRNGVSPPTFLGKPFKMPVNIRRRHAGAAGRYLIGGEFIVMLGPHAFPLFGTPLEGGSPHLLPIIDPSILTPKRPFLASSRPTKRMPK